MTRAFVETMRVALMKSDRATGEKEDARQLTHLLTQDRGIFDAFIRFLFDLLTVKDEQAISRTIAMCRLFVQLLNDRTTTADMARYIVEKLIVAIRLHGNEDMTLSPLLTLFANCYDELSKHSTVLLEVLNELSELNIEDIRGFADKMVSTKERRVPDKIRKDAVLQLLRPFLPSRQEEMISRKKQRNRVPRNRRPKPAEREATPDLSENLA